MHYAKKFEFCPHVPSWDPLTRCLHVITHHLQILFACSTLSTPLSRHSRANSGFVMRADVESCIQNVTRERTPVRQAVALPTEGITKVIALDYAVVWIIDGASGVCRPVGPSVIPHSWSRSPRRCARRHASVHRTAQIHAHDPSQPSQGQPR